MPKPFELTIGATYTFQLERKDPQLRNIRGELCAKVIDKIKHKNGIRYFFLVMNRPHGFKRYAPMDNFIAYVDYNAYNPCIYIGDYDHCLRVIKQSKVLTFSLFTYTLLRTYYI